MIKLSYLKKKNMFKKKHLYVNILSENEYLKIRLKFYN